jgi:hypothetical protein
MSRVIGYCRVSTAAQGEASGRWSCTHPRARPAQPGCDPPFRRGWGESEAVGRLLAARERSAQARTRPVWRAQVSILPARLP